jgi:hypothetical protein
MSRYRLNTIELLHGKRAVAERKNHEWNYEFIFEERPEDPMSEVLEEAILNVREIAAGFGCGAAATSRRSYASVKSRSRAEKLLQSIALRAIDMPRA